MSARFPQCPECATGKHRNCDGTSWSNELDREIACVCELADHHYVDGPEAHSSGVTS